MDEQSINKEQLTQLTAQQYKAYLEAKRHYVLQDFWAFSQEVVGWKDLYDPLHHPLCDFIQNNQGHKRLMLLPRGHLKSSVGTVGYSLWKIAQDPKIRILIAAGTYDMAVTFLSQIKDHITKNEKFRELFGDLYTGSIRWAENQITVVRPESYERKEPTVTAFGIGGNLVSQHYDIIIGDDIVTRDNIHTPERMADVLTFYRDVLDLLDNPTDSEVLFFGTRWHEGDLYGHIMDPGNPDSAQWRVMTRTAIEGEYSINRDKEGHYKIEGGTIIFPNKFSREGLESLINSKGPSEFSSQYLNDPVPSSEAMFKHDFKYYEVEDIRGQEVNRFITIDPAFYDPKSKTVDLDHAVFLVNDVNEENMWFIRDIIRERMTPNEIVDMMFLLDELWHPKTIAIESTAFQKILAYMVRDEMKKRNRFLPITELKHAGQGAKSKAERIQALEPRYATGSIFHNQGIKHMNTLEFELRRFPRGRTDDCADALASQLEVAHPPAKRQERRRSIGRALSYPA